MLNHLKILKTNTFGDGKKFHNLAAEFLSSLGIYRKLEIKLFSSLENDNKVSIKKTWAVTSQGWAKFIYGNVLKV